MLFLNRELRTLIKSVPIGLFLCIYLAGAAGAWENKTYKPKVVRRRRVSRGGNYSPQNTALYKGESPCKVGPGLVQEIDSKFCGFYDYKADMAKEKDTQE